MVGSEEMHICASLFEIHHWWLDDNVMVAHTVFKKEFISINNTGLRYI